MLDKEVSQVVQRVLNITLDYWKNDSVHYEHFIKQLHS